MIAQPIPLFEIRYTLTAHGEGGEELDRTEVVEGFRFLEPALQRFRHLNDQGFPVELRNLEVGS